MDHHVTATHDGRRRSLWFLIAYVLNLLKIRIFLFSNNQQMPFGRLEFLLTKSPPLLLLYHLGRVSLHYHIECINILDENQIPFRFNLHSVVSSISVWSPWLFFYSSFCPSVFFLCEWKKLRTRREAIGDRPLPTCCRLSHSLFSNPLDTRRLKYSPVQRNGNEAVDRGRNRNPLNVRHRFAHQSTEDPGCKRERERERDRKREKLRHECHWSVMIINQSI